MNELSQKLQQALQEVVEQVKRQLAKEALAMLQTLLPAIVPGVPPMKRHDETAEEDLDSLSVQALDTWLAWEHGFCSDEGGN